MAQLDILNKVKKLTKSLPETPGVYKMLDEKGTIIYIGKAKDLKKRVTSYFSKTTGQSIKTQKMVEAISDINIIETENELEAILLETNLIKEHRPKYNVLMKDDKNFIYIKITTNEDFPRILTVRERQRDGSIYFGPKTSATQVEKTLDLLRKIFPTRTCNLDMKWLPATQQSYAIKKHNKAASSQSGAASDSFGSPAPLSGVGTYPERGAERRAEGPAGSVSIRNKSIPIPCLEYHIKRCNAPCINKESKSDYNATIKRVIQFLKGNYRDIVTQLRYQMFAEAKLGHFEKAAKLRDQIKATENLFSKQKVSDPTFIDRDIIGLHPDFDKTFINLFQFREGKLVGQEQFALNIPEASNDNPLENFIKFFYSDSTSIPSEILVRDLPEDKTTIEEWLTKRYEEIPGNEETRKHVHLITTKIGQKDHILKMSEKNAQLFANQSRTKWMSDAAKTSQAARDLADELGLTSGTSTSEHENRSPSKKCTKGSSLAPPFKGELSDTTGGGLRGSKGKGLGKGVGVASTLKRIECYDISHMGGEHTTASMVVFIDGAPQTKLYRSFKIRLLETGEIDDYASIKEILQRRLKRLAEHQTNDLSHLTFKKPTKQQQEALIKNAADHKPINFSNSVLASEKDGTPIIFAYLIDHENGKYAEVRFLVIANETKVDSVIARSPVLGTTKQSPEQKSSFRPIFHELLRKLIEKTKLFHIYTVTNPQIVDHFESFGFTRLKKVPDFMKEGLQIPPPAKGEVARSAGGGPHSTGEAIPLIYKIDRTKKPDDSFSQIPDLIIVDGGKGQLSVAHQAILKSGLPIPVIGLAKREEEIFMPLTSVIARSSSDEAIWEGIVEGSVATSREPRNLQALTDGSFLRITLPPNSQALYLVQRIRDEAHRFANELRKKLGKKQLTASEIDQIPGIGVIMKRRLLKEFGSIQKIKDTSLEELEKSVGTYIAKMLKEKL